MAPAAKKGSSNKPSGGKPGPAKGGSKSAPPKGAPQKKPALPESVVVRRTSEIDPENPMGFRTSAADYVPPVRAIWVEAARQARDDNKVVIDLVGEGRGIIAIPVSFKNEKEAMEVMTPALDALVTHCTSASQSTIQPVMVDLQELRERLKLEPEEDWVAEHGWLHNALSGRELLCMYVFSPGYLLEFALAFGDKQEFEVAISRRDPGFYDLTPRKGTDNGVIVWNWARAMGDVIAGGHSWSYFGMLLALAPTVAERQRVMAKSKTGAMKEEE